MRSRGTPTCSRPRCVGLPDERLGEVPVAAVRVAAGATARRSSARGVGRASDSPTTRCPSRVVAVDELPRTGTRKVQKRELLALFAA